MNPPEPTLFSTMPLAAPLTPTLKKFTPPVPIVVLAIFTPTPVVVEIVLLDPVAVTVPPPVAVKAALPLVLKAIVPEKLTVAPELLLKNIPVPVETDWEIDPGKLTVPPVLLSMSITRPLVFLVMLPP